MCSIMVSSRAARRALPACALLLTAIAARAQAPDTTALRLDALLAEVAEASPALRAARLEAAAMAQVGAQVGALPDPLASLTVVPYRSEEHTSELQSRENLVCRLLLEKKKTNYTT